MISTLLYFLLALLLLVLVHEYGHFQVARWCGVKVLRFSFGFGPVLFSWHDKKNTQYACSLVPLGGYVKMLDESEGEVAEDEKHQAFNNQSVWKRIAIVLAGPLFNFLFAFVALWLVLIIGIYSLAPMIGEVKPGSIAAVAGLHEKQEIVRLNGEKINSWRDFQYGMMPLIGTQENITLELKSLTDGQSTQVSLPLAHWKLDDKKPDPLNSLGIVPFIPTMPPIVGEVVPNSPAALAGLRVADKILRIDNKSFDDWLFLVDYVKAHPATKMTLTIDREGSTKQVELVSGSQIKEGKNEGFLGLRAQKPDWPAHWLRLQREGPVTALGTAAKQTWELSKTTVTLMARLVTGKLGLKSISGPVGIAQGAGDSGRSGLAYYLFFLALVSIGLGVLNLLPIPMLDGGHLLYYVVELIQRKPVSEEVKSIGVYLGMVLLMALMAIALTNDISRLIS